MADRYYVLGPYENNERHSICRENQTGGDPLTIVTIYRLHRPDDLYEMIERANASLSPGGSHE